MIRRRTRRPLPKCARTRNARRTTATTARGSRIPGMVQLALDAFDASDAAAEPDRSETRRREGHARRTCSISAQSSRSPKQGLRTNVSVGVQYLEAWLRGSGAVPIFNLMEDAATAEISRAQVWQWIRHPRGVLSDGRKVTKEFFRSVLEEELAKIEGDRWSRALCETGNFDTARELVRLKSRPMMSSPSFSPCRPTITRD